MTLGGTILPRFYRAGMRVTRRRGSHTLARINARLFPNGQTITQPSGESFYLPPDPHVFGYLIGHETHVRDVIDRFVEPRDTVLDIGANIGHFAVQMAHRAGAAGRVIAYEIDGTNLSYLTRNRALAARQGWSVEIVQAAVSDAAGTLTVVPGAQSTLHKVSREQGAGRSVPAVSIDDEVARLGLQQRIGVVKIDVEGHEPLVLKGMARTVREGKVRAMVLEITPGDAAHAIADQLDAWRAEIRSVTTWVDGGWSDTPVKDLAWRTDSLVTFN